MLNALRNRSLGSCRLRSNAGSLNTHSDIPDSEHRLALASTKVSIPRVSIRRDVSFNNM